MNYRDIYEHTVKVSEDLKLAYELKEMHRDFNKNCSYEEAPARLDYQIDLFEEADLACHKEFVQLLKNWKPEIINSFNRPYTSRKQSNALAESYNQKLLSQKKSPISWILLYFHPGFPVFKTHSDFT